MVTVRKLGQGLLEKMHLNNRVIINVNSFLLIGGIIGFIPPTLAAVLHNSCTIGISLASMRLILNANDE